MTHLRFALDEDLTDQRLESLCQRRIRDVALVLIELAGREEAARRKNRIRARVRGYPGPRPEQTPQAEHRPRAPARTASLGSAIGLMSRAHPKRMDRCDHATALPPGTAEGRLPSRRQSGSAPRHSWRAAS